MKLTYNKNIDFTVAIGIKREDLIRKKADVKNKVTYRGGVAYGTQEKEDKPDNINIYKWLSKRTGKNPFAQLIKSRTQRKATNKQLGKLLSSALVNDKDKEVVGKFLLEDLLTGVARGELGYTKIGFRRAIYTGQLLESLGYELRYKCGRATISNH